MGISGLLPLLRSIHKPKHVRSYAGKTVGVDAYGWIHKGTISCAIDLALDKPTTKYVDYVLHRVRMLLHFGVTPYLVFDGDYLPSKGGTEAERERRRAHSKAAGLELLKAGRSSQAYAELQKAVDVTPLMARVVIDACRRVGAKCVVAPYEADAQLYYLEKIGVIDAVMSEDSDMLVFGTKCLITKLDQYGECVELNRADFTRCKEVSMAGWSDAEFRLMCILSGCDYLESIPKMGLKTAHRFVRSHKGIEKILRAVQFAGMAVPNGYLEAFRRAELTFRHQRVFCPQQQKLVMCNDPDPVASPLDDEALIHIGPDIDKDIARGVACGDLCPMTKAPITVPKALTTTNLTRSQSWTPRTSKGTFQQTSSSKNTKIITSFFKPTGSAPTPTLASPQTPLQPRNANIQVPHFARSFSTPSLMRPEKRALDTPDTGVKRQKVDEGVGEEGGDVSEYFSASSSRRKKKLAAVPTSRPKPKATEADKENLRPASSNTPSQDPDAASVLIPSSSPLQTPTKKLDDQQQQGVLVPETPPDDLVVKGWKQTYTRSNNHKPMPLLPQNANCSPLKRKTETLPRPQSVMSPSQRIAVRATGGSGGGDGGLFGQFAYGGKRR